MSIKQVPLLQNKANNKTIKCVAVNYNMLIIYYTDKTFSIIGSDKDSVYDDYNQHKTSDIIRAFLEDDIYFDFKPSVSKEILKNNIS